MSGTKPKRCWYQFSSRTVVILVVLVSVALGWYAVKMERARRQRVAVEVFEKLGGRIAYDRESADRPMVLDFFGGEGPRAEVTDTDLVHLKWLTSLHTLNLSRTQVTDVGLEHLEGLTSLRSLLLIDTRVTDAGLEPLNELTNLNYLRLYNTQVTDEGINGLRRALPNCQITH